MAHTEAWIDNAGGMYLYTIEDGNVIWGADYSGAQHPEQQAANDFCAIAGGADPVDDGWELGSFGGIEDARSTYAWMQEHDGPDGCETIASTDWGATIADMLANDDPEDTGNVAEALFIKAALA